MAHDCPDGCLNRLCIPCGGGIEYGGKNEQSKYDNEWGDAYPLAGSHDKTLS